MGGHPSIIALAAGIHSFVTTNRLLVVTK